MELLMDENEELAPLPENVLPSRQVKLKELILTDPIKAIELLRKDTIAVVALSKVKFQLEENNNENVKKFFELLEQEKEKIIEIQGKDHIALTLELVIDLWRTEFEKNKFTSYLDFIDSKIKQLEKIIEEIENTSENRVIREMLDDFIRRKISLEQYEIDKSEKNFVILRPYLNNFVETILKVEAKEEIAKEWLALFLMGTMTSLGAKVFRKNLSSLILENLKEKFDDLDEDLKYSIAPWLKAFEIMGKSDEETN